MATRRSPDAPPEGFFPLAAQIPLQSFVFPIFPPQASRLRELTLTCDIQLDEYQQILNKHSLDEQREKQLSPNTHVRRSSYNASNSLVFHAPNLPPSITSIALELFRQGFPVGWLKSVARSLPKLRSLTFFSCLIDGLDDGSRNDAVSMLEMLKLRNLHVIDSFTRPGFWREAAIGLSEEHERAKEAYTEHEDGNRRHSARGLQAIEMSYTYRGHSDPEFMSRIAGEELPELLGSGVVAASFNLLAPPNLIPGENGQENDLLEDPANLDENGQLIDNRRPEGILPFPEYGRASSALRKRFERLSSGKDLGKLRMLNISLWTLRPEEVGQVLYSCAGGGSGVLEDLCISVLMRPGWWDELLKSLTDHSQALEGLEVVGVPDDDEKEQVGTKVVQDIFDQANDIEKLRLACARLVRFDMTILRAKSFGRVAWNFDAQSGTWNGGFVPGKGQNGHSVPVKQKET
jgi:hypothetical protein